MILVQISGAFGFNDNARNDLKGKKTMTNFRLSLQKFFCSKLYNAGITAVILINCVVLGVETTAFGKGEHKSVLQIIDEICLIIFTIELGLRIFAFKLAFFIGKDKGWNLFDFIIVAISLFGASQSSVLRALRVFRALRLLSVLPQMRLVTEAMLHTLPSLLGVAVLLLIFYYVYAVLCVNLFGAQFPELFGNLGVSFGTLFQLMIMDDFGNLVRPISEKFAYAWVVFVSFVLIVGFVVLNLVVGIIVESINEIKEQRGRK